MKRPISATVASILTLSLALPLSVLSEVGGSQAQTIAAGQEYSISSQGESGWRLNIPSDTFGEETSLLLQPVQANSAAFEGEGVSLVGQVMEIKVADREAVRLNQPVQVTMRIPIDEIPTAENIDNFFAAYWKGTEWEYIFPDLSALYEGKVIFQTYHFSSFATAELTDEQKTKLYAQKIAVQAWETEEKEKALSEQLQGAFDEAFTSMGIDDDTVKGELFRYVSKETDFGTLLVSAQDGDLTKFAGRCSKLAANAVIEKFYSDRGFSKNLGKFIGASGTGLANAVLQLSDGNTEGALKELNKAIINYFPAGRAFTATVEVINASIASWKDYEMDSAYQAYTGLVHKGVYGFTVDPGDWTALATQIDPYIRQLQTEAKDRYCKVNGISRAQLDADNALSERIANLTVDNLKMQFEKRISNEDAIKAREEQYQRLIAGFERDGLLDRDKFRFGSRDDIRDRLRSLFKIRANILDMVGGEIPYEMGGDPERNMNDAITEWIVRGPEDRAGFYEWMIEKGYIKASHVEPTWSPTDLSGNWILTWLMPDGSANEFPMTIQMNQDNTGIVSITGIDGTQTIVIEDSAITVNNSWKGRIFSYNFLIESKNGDVTLTGGAVTYSGKKGSGNIGTATVVRAE